MDVPEIFKSLTGRSRYEALVGTIQGLAFMLDSADSLIKSCEPPPGSLYQYAARVEDVQDAHKQAAESLRNLQTKVKTFEAELVAKPWKVG